MDRFYIPAEQWLDPADVLSLPSEEAHHCHRVMRKDVGATIELFDGEGRSATAKILSSSKSEVQVKVTSLPEQQLKIRPQLVLCQAVPKGKNMELIVQKAVELGVAEIIPLLTERTIVKAEVKHREKWQRIALEACKQCGQNWLPKVHEPTTFKKWISENPSQQGITASLAEGAQPLAQAIKTLQGTTEPLNFLVGPEGDLSPEEVDQATQTGLVPITLGKIILRVETATLYGISVLRHSFSA